MDGAKSVGDEGKPDERGSSRNPSKSNRCSLSLKKSANTVAISTIGSDANKNTVEVNSEDEHRIDNALAVQDNVDTDESAEECLSTDGEETDPDSPFYPDSQYLNQSNDLRAALINSKALTGDYVELKNCKRCGSMIFKD